MKHDETSPCLLDRASPGPATEEQVASEVAMSLPAICLPSFTPPQ